MTARIEMIVAQDMKGLIGLEVGGKHTIPWSVPTDLKQFKEFTLGKTIIMGWNTWLSIGCRMLPKRDHIIVTSKWCSAHPSSYDEPMKTVLGKGVNPNWENNKKKVMDGSLIFTPIHHLHEILDQDKVFVVCGGNMLYTWFDLHYMMDEVRITTVMADIPINGIPTYLTFKPNHQYFKKSVVGFEGMKGDQYPFRVETYTSS